MPKQMIEVEVPEGYRAVKYGIPKAGDLYLETGGINLRVEKSRLHQAFSWLIVEKIEEEKSTLQQVIETEATRGTTFKVVEQEKPMTQETPKPTVTVDCEIPEGFELQGEFRKPKKGEWFFNGLEAIKSTKDFQRESLVILKKKPVTQKVELELIPPEGFRFTGEYRATGHQYQENFSCQHYVIVVAN